MAAPTHKERDVSGIPQDKVDDARRAFFIKHADATPEKYDPRDLDKLRSSDHLVKLYLLQQKQDIDKAVRMMEASLSWRKSMDVQDIAEDSFRKEDLEKGAVYYHGTDNKGDKILYFRAAEVKKEAESLRAARRMTAMLLERQQRLCLGQPVVVLLDLSDVGMGNVDLELIKFLITSFTTYFPAMLSYMLIYDMPWIVNAVWNIVKQLLSEEEQKHVIFAKKATIQQYIDCHQLWRHMGGTNDYVYKYMPWSEPNQPPTSAAAAATNGVEESCERPSNGDAIDAISLGGGGGSGRGGEGPSTPMSIRRRLAFVSADSLRSSSTTDLRRVSFRDISRKQESQTKDGPSNIPVAGVNSALSKTDVASSTDQMTGTLVLDPALELVFARVRPEDESRALLRLRNDSAQHMLYKVKTTNPDHYRVKSSTGCLAPGTVHTVQIALLAGKEVKADKFLVQFAPTDEAVPPGSSPSSSSWSSVGKDRIQERRLRCVMKQWRPAPPMVDQEIERRGTLSDIQRGGVDREANGIVEAPATSLLSQPVAESALPALSVGKYTVSQGRGSGGLPEERPKLQPAAGGGSGSNELAAELRSLRRLVITNTALLLLVVALFSIYIVSERLWLAAKP